MISPITPLSRNGLSVCSPGWDMDPPQTTWLTEVNLWLHYATLCMLTGLCDWCLIYFLIPVKLSSRKNYMLLAGLNYQVSTTAIETFILVDVQLFINCSQLVVLFCSGNSYSPPPPPRRPYLVIGQDAPQHLQQTVVQLVSTNSLMLCPFFGHGITNNHLGTCLWWRQHVWCFTDTMPLYSMLARTPSIG